MKKTFKTIVSMLVLFVLSFSMLAACKTESANTITVTFDANCTEITLNETKKVTPGEAYGELPVITATREGYTFDGWSAKKDGSGKAITAETVVPEAKGDHTLYAKWAGLKYEISFDLQGGNIGGQTEIPAATVTYGNMYGGLAIPNNPEKENCKFMGWYLNADGTGNAITMNSKVSVAANHTLYAKWKEKYTNYTFDEADMLDDWSNRNDTYDYGIADVDGDKKLKITHPGEGNDSLWIVLFSNLKAGQTITMDVEVQSKTTTDVRYGFFCYGATAAGDPMTSGSLGDAGNPGWYWGQGVYSDESPEKWNNGKFSITINIKEDCYGLSVCMCFGRTSTPNNVADAEIWKNTVFYIDNVVIHSAAEA